MTNASFHVEGDRYLPTPRAGSPWGDGLLHGGPPAGLLARAIERFAATPELQVVRLTTDLFRQVPRAPLEVTTRTLRQGRRIHVVESSLRAAGVEVCRATGLLLRTSDVSPRPASSEPASPPGPDTVPPSRLSPATSDRPRREGFYDHIDVRRIPRREESDSQPVWVRLTGTLIEGEDWSPVSRVAATCDFLNAMSGGGRSNAFPSINVDSTVYLHRPPRGEWICMEVARTLDPLGIGVVRAPLYDLEGLFGMASQAVLRNDMPA
jgi:acyl-CoA thioesterase